MIKKQVACRSSCGRLSLGPGEIDQGDLRDLLPCHLGLRVEAFLGELLIST